MNDEERRAVLDRAQKNLMAAGFDNVVILVNEGGSQGMVTISAYAKPALMRFLLASYFMDECISKMLEEDSEGRKVWEILCSSILKTISPQIREMENEMKEENKTPHAEVIPFHSFPKD